jgi:hypothetical protein
MKYIQTLVALILLSTVSMAYNSTYLDANDKISFTDFSQRMIDSVVLGMSGEGLTISDYFLILLFCVILYLILKTFKNVFFGGHRR